MKIKVLLFLASALLVSGAAVAENAPKGATGSDVLGEQWVHEERYPFVRMADEEVSRVLDNGGSTLRIGQVCNFKPTGLTTRSLECAWTEEMLLDASFTPIGKRGGGTDPGVEEEYFGNMFATVAVILMMGAAALALSRKNNLASSLAGAAVVTTLSFLAGPTTANVPYVILVALLAAGIAVGIPQVAAKDSNAWAPLLSLASVVVHGISMAVIVGLMPIPSI